MNYWKIILVAAGLMIGSVRADDSETQHELQCIEASARLNSLPIELLQSVRTQEGGHIGSWHTNADGSIDYGVMQINSRWLPLLAQKGYTASVLAYDACASIAVGAWILAQSLANADAWNHTSVDSRAYWRAIGDYHSHTRALNRIYTERIWVRYRQQMVEDIR